MQNFKICRILVAAFLLLMLASFAYAQESKIGNISFFIGRPQDVQIKHKSDKTWCNAGLKMTVRNADKIRTRAESRCEVKLLEGSVVRIGENSEFEFTDASVKKSSKKVKARLKRGKIWSNITRLRAKQEGFQIKTPTAVCAVRGTIYRIDADSSTKCLVYAGVVDVGPTSFWGQSQAGKSKSLKPVEVPGPYEIPPPYEVSLEEWVRIVKGFQIVVRPDGKFAKSRFDKAQDAKLDWVRWNKQRDLALKRN